MHEFYEKEGDINYVCGQIIYNLLWNIVTTTRQPKLYVGFVYEIGFAIKTHIKLKIQSLGLTSLSLIA
jgi:hypothetical protein